MNLTTKQGTISEYNSIICKGKVILKNGEIIQFHLTSFQSSLPTRFPYLNEDVIVAFDGDHLISVRTDIEKQKEYFTLDVKPINVTNHPFPQEAHDKGWNPEIQKQWTKEDINKMTHRLMFLDILLEKLNP